MHAQLESKRRMRQARVSAGEIASADLVSIAAEHALGSVINEVDALCATLGPGNVPAAAVTLGHAIHALLWELGVRDGMHPDAARIYRERV